MKTGLLVGLCLLGTPIFAQATSNNMIEVCTAAGESRSLCDCGQAQADALMEPALQELVVAGMLTGKPSNTQMRAQGVTKTQVFDLMVQWSSAVEQNCTR